MTVKLHIPGEPQGKQRHRTTRSGHTYTPDKTRQYEEKVKAAYRLRYGDRMQWGGKIPLKILVVAGYRIPKSASKRTKDAMKRTKDAMKRTKDAMKRTKDAMKRTKDAMQKGEISPTKKPDADNVLKVIADSLNGLCYRDEAQIVDAEVHKYYTDQPGVDVMIWEKDDEEKRDDVS